ncbi:hypothetical protein cypCar_00033654, partial [Cyprinus carpio]
LQNQNKEEEDEEEDEGSELQDQDPSDPECVEERFRMKLELMLTVCLMFDLKDEGESNPRKLAQIMQNLGVFISVKPKVKQTAKSVVVKGLERNISSQYEARCLLLGLDSTEVSMTTKNVSEVSMTTKTPWTLWWPIMESQDHEYERKKLLATREPEPRDYHFYRVASLCAARESELGKVGGVTVESGRGRSPFHYTGPFLPVVFSAAAARIGGNSLTHSPSRVSDTLRSNGRAARPVSNHPFGSGEPSRLEMMLSLGLFVSLVVWTVSVTGGSDGNPLDNDKWMSTVSQYDKSKYWNKFRDEPMAP